MTNEQINIAVAKIDGYIKLSNGFLTKNGVYARRDNFNYTESYDAILPVIQRLNDEGGWLFAEEVRKIITDNNFFWMATPLQLCIALLKDKGLYEP